MNIVIKNNYIEKKKAIRNIVLFFIACTAISYLFAIITGTYNGDFIGVKVTISPLLLFGNFIISIIPYLILWLFYKHYRGKSVRHPIKINMIIFYKGVILTLVLHLIVTLLFGVGKMAADDYHAPAILVPFIQILNRFSPVYFGGLFILMSDNKKKNIVVAILIIIVCIARFSLGAFFYLSLIYYFKNYSSVTRFLKTHFVITLLILIVSPIVLQFLFSSRDNLRGQENYKYSTALIIPGRVIGRISSFSNSAYFLENMLSFKWAATKEMDPDYFSKELISGILGVKYTTDDRPARIILGDYYAKIKNIGFMVGIPGTLIMSYLYSNSTFWINLFLLLLVICLSFKTFRLIDSPFCNEYVIIFMIFPMTSGVGNEFTFTITCFLVIIMFFKISNILSIHRTVRP